MKVPMKVFCVRAEHGRAASKSKQREASPSLAAQATPCANSLARARDYTDAPASMRA